MLLLPESSAKAGAGSQAKDLCDALKEQMHQLCELQLNYRHFPFDGSLSKDHPGVLEHRLSLSTDMSSHEHAVLEKTYCWDRKLNILDVDC